MNSKTKPINELSEFFSKSMTSLIHDLESQERIIFYLNNVEDHKPAVELKFHDSEKNEHYLLDAIKKRSSTLLPLLTLIETKSGKTRYWYPDKIFEMAWTCIDISNDDLNKINNYYLEKIAEKKAEEEAKKAEEEEARIKEIKTEKQTRGVKDNGLIIKNKGFPELFYLVPKENIKSILEKGVLSKNEVTTRNIKFTDFSIVEAQNRRHSKNDPFHKNNIHDYVPLLFNILSPMLYYLKDNQDSLVILHIDTQHVLTENLCLFSDGNLASNASNLSENYIDDDALYILFKEEYWGAKSRERAAEVLIHKRIMPKYINGMSCNSEQTLTEIMPLCKENNIPIKLNKEFFFND